MKYAGDTFERSASGLVIPDRLRAKAEHQSDVATCPAAQIVNHDGEPAVRCGVAGDVMKIRQSPIACGLWCMGEPGAYSQPEVGCPIWRASKENPDRIDRAKAAAERRDTDRLTLQQIERGIRVDDRLDKAIEGEANKLADDLRAAANAPSAIFADYGEG